MTRFNSSLPASTAHSATRSGKLLAAAVSAVMLSAAPVWAQNNSTTGPNAGATGMIGATGNGDPNAGGVAARRSSNDRSEGNVAGRNAKQDAKLMSELARANIAEIEISKIALEKAQSEDTRRFAQQMIDDHSKAMTDLENLASAKGVKLPSEPDASHRKLARNMKDMDGKQFEAQYRNRAGIDDHQSTLKLLQKVKKDGNDPQLKSIADQMQPVVQHHLDMAKQMKAQGSPASKG